MIPIDLGSDLLNYIVKQGFQPGDRLPTISELAEPAHLNISVSKVREQLEVARNLGLVEVRSRTGTRIQEYTFTPAVRLSLFFALATSFDHFEAFSTLRVHVEAAFWHEACALLTDDDKQVMKHCITRAMTKLNAPNIQIPNEEHRIFHLTVFKHLKNPFVQGLLEAYWDAYASVAVHHYADYDYHKAVWEYHEQILDAICEGDFDTAQNAFMEHTRLLRYPASLKGESRQNS